MNLTPITEADFAPLLAEHPRELGNFEFIEVDFTTKDIRGLLFLDSKFTHCNLANTSLQNTAFRGVVFEECNLMGTIWPEVRKGATVSFRGSKLDYCSFQALDLRSTDFTSSTIREADFASANLAKASFAHANLVGTSFAGANLEKTDFRGAKNYYFDPRTVKIKGAKFNFPEVIALIEAFGAEVEI